MPSGGPSITSVRLVSGRVSWLVCLTTLAPAAAPFVWSPAVAMVPCLPGSLRGKLSAICLTPERVPTRRSELPIQFRQRNAKVVPIVSGYIVAVIMFNKKEYDRNYMREKRKNDPARDKAITKKSRENNPEKRLWQQAKYRARRTGLEFDLTVEDIKIPIVCPVFGAPLYRHDGARANNSPSLDRIDNSKGYVKDNVWVISWRANRIKWNVSLEELEALVEAIRKVSHRASDNNR